jgi:hypothetical protein
MRTTMVFDAKGKAYEYQNGELVWSRPDLDSSTVERAHGITVIPDLPPFRSSIDGTMICGRRAMREHCARYDVVPTADLAGLPTKLVNNPTFTPEYREGTKRAIYDELREV